MQTKRYHARTPLGRFVNSFEENALAVLMGLMTLVTFINVVLRYGFNSSLIWGLEVTLILFAWLVIFGISYCVKVTAHLGVDALTNLFQRRGRKVFAVVSAICCVAYAALLLKGAWVYWAPFAALQPTEGRWFPLGFTEGVRDRAFYVTDQVPMLEMFRWLEPLINYGEEYEKLPRVIPYAILPVGCALILFRFAQAAYDVITDKRESLIVSHEAEDAVEEAAAQNKETN